MLAAHLTARASVVEHGRFEAQTKGCGRRAHRARGSPVQALATRCCNHTAACCPHLALPFPPCSGRVFAEARRAAAAEYAAAAAGSAAPRRRSQDGASSGGGERGRRRRQLLSQLAEAGPLAGGDEDAGSSSGDDTLSSAYATVARRLRRGGAAPSRLGLCGRGGGASTKARWVGRLAMLATIKMVHAMLARR